eukprot:6190041-Pleurochrysis_carterae.AAC.2
MQRSASSAASHITAPSASGTPSGTRFRSPASQTPTGRRGTRRLATCSCSYGRAAITWTSKKQPTVALSSCEAEIVAASEAAKEAVYLRALLEELGEPADDATSLHLDN